MNIFEQFGIKEVADVTIYAIDLDKYDDEIYIPIMYLDTLKVSTIEQTASQTSACGGLGNAELISWDFGKEISVSLQDALFTPASQSLMWGGKYGIRKPEIYGMWNPYIYPKDDTGAQVYTRKVDAEVQEAYNDEGSFVKVQKQAYGFIKNTLADEFTLLFNVRTTSLNQEVAPTGAYSLLLNSDIVTLGKVVKVELDSDSQGISWIITTSVDGFLYSGHYIIKKTDLTSHYVEEVKLKYISYTGENNVLSQDEIPLVLDTFKQVTFICPCDGETKNQFLVPAGGRYLYELVNEATLYVDDRCPIDKPLYESEESTEPLHIYTLASTHLKESAYWKNSKTPEVSSIKIDKFGAFTYSTSALVHEADEVDRCFYQEADYCDNTLIKCTEESIDAYAYEWRDSSVILNSFERSQDSYYLDSLNIRFRIRNEDGHREIGIGYNTDDYSTEIDVYKDIVQKYRDINGFEEEAVVSVKMGTFYVIDDWNASETTPQDIASLINTGINNVDLLETMEKCIATKTFAIDADKNVRCSNYRYDPRYKDKALTVFIDPRTMRPYEPNTTSYLTEDGVSLQGNFAIIRQNDIYYKWSRKVSDGLSSLGYQIIVDADHFPGTYKIVGETYARSRNDGQDKHYQFEIPLCKLSAENNITLEAAGDPTTFTMNFKVLRKDDGTMMKLTQYGETVSRLEEYLPPLPDENPSEPGRGAYRAVPVSKSYAIINPDENTIQYTDIDEDAPLDGSSTGHVNQADQEFINSITEETSKSWPEDEPIPDVTLTSQEITPEGEALLETNIDEVIVREQTNYDIEQEKVVIYADGTTVPTGEWEKVDEYTSNRFLAPDEYALEANAEANSR